MSKRYSPYDIQQQRYAAGVKKRRVARQQAIQRQRSAAQAITMYKAMPRFQTYQPNVRTGGYVGIEKKFYDTSKAGTALVAPSDASGGEVDPTTGGLNTVAQGDGESNRDGRSMVMHSIHINGTIFGNAQTNQSTGDQPGHVVVALVLDTQTNGAQLNSEDVFQNSGAQTYLAASPFRNLQYVKRFKVLKKYTMTIDPPEMVYDGTNIEQSGWDIPFTMNVDLKRLKVNFSSTTSAIANIVDNSLHLVAFCSSTDLAPAITYNARLRFSG